jgi:hypothetical protein
VLDVGWPGKVMLAEVSIITTHDGNPVRITTREISVNRPARTSKTANRNAVSPNRFTTDIPAASRR